MYTAWRTYAAECPHKAVMTTFHRAVLPACACAIGDLSSRVSLIVDCCTHRNEIEIIAREQEALATASSSILAIKVTPR